MNDGVIRPVATHLDRAERLEAALKEYRDFRLQVEADLGLDAEDGRIVFLKNVASFARMDAVFLRLLHHCAQSPEQGQLLFLLSAQEKLHDHIKTASKVLSLFSTRLYEIAYPGQRGSHI